MTEIQFAPKPKGKNCSEKTMKKHMVTAAAIAKEYGGCLPNSMTLLKINTPFYSFFRTHKEAFLEKFPQVVLDKNGIFLAVVGGTAAERERFTKKYMGGKSLKES